MYFCQTSFDASSPNSCLLITLQNGEDLPNSTGYLQAPNPSTNPVRMLPDQNPSYSHDVCNKSQYIYCLSGVTHCSLWKTNLYWCNVKISIINKRFSQLAICQSSRLHNRATFCYILQLLVLGLTRNSHKFLNLAVVIKTDIDCTLQ